ncbi:unnamed protein product [Microthlaspi erraticum]|uniref:Retrotransposon gag domain-containing protein n=1 Tax=Microthlaspi erraticum TaxID=1685480 RepID=A0A6D2I7C4_9BRAS|nr:unnamed protein product [Microthlaspi erraticum]
MADIFFLHVRVQQKNENVYFFTRNTYESMNQMLSPQLSPETTFHVQRSSSLGMLSKLPFIVFGGKETLPLGAAPAQGRDDLYVGLLTQMLARFSPAVPHGALGVPPVAEAQQRAAVVGLPPYLEMMGHMQRIATPFVEGRAELEKADEWRLRLEQNFRSIRCPLEYQVELVVHYLSGDAHLWWRAIEGRRAVWTWGEFLEEFNAKYFSQEARDRLHIG